jgi:hypothetical protein
MKITIDIKITATGPQGCGKTLVLNCLRSELPKILITHALLRGQPIECDVKTEEVQETNLPPAPAVVPLGPNRTRDGQEVRVICNDRNHRLFKPVMALVATGKGEETRSYELTGRYDKARETPVDLVGHLPPEPVKPKEYRLEVSGDGETFVRSGPSLNPGESITVREVID